MVSTPPGAEKPPRLFAPRTRWQGMISGIGLAPQAWPTACAGAPVARDDKRHALVRGRGVEWVRPTDLIARHSAHAAGRGLDFQAELARRTRTPLGAGVRRLGDRARRLPPISAFGCSTAPASQVSRSGVSMS